MSDSTDQGQSAVALEMRMQVVKEVVTAGLAFLLIGFTLVTAFRVMNMAGDEAKMKDAMSVLTLLFGLAGVVIGYYFGRIPSDARAAQAQQAAQDASKEMGRMDAAMNRGRAAADRVDDAMAQMQYAMVDAGMSPGKPSQLGPEQLKPAVTTLNDQIKRARAELKTLKGEWPSVRQP